MFPSEMWDKSAQYTTHSTAFVPFPGEKCSRKSRLPNDAALP
jgi:hypothetical protein